MAMEIWNEPNAGSQWSGAADDVAYANLLSTTTAYLRSPGTTFPSSTQIIVGGLGGFRVTGGGDISYQQFLSTVYSVAGPTSFDGIGIHAYPINPDQSGAGDCPDPDPLCPVYTIVGDVRNVRDQNGDSGKPIWLTEFGATASHNATNSPPPAGGSYANGGTWFPDDFTTYGQGKVAEVWNWARAQPDFAVALDNFVIDPVARTALGISNSAPERTFGVVYWAVQTDLLTGKQTKVYGERKGFGPLANAFGS